YKARQPTLARLVALKILPPTIGAEPGFTERFTREAQALARLNHPNIVAVHDFGKAGHFHYFLMEFVDGPNLRQIEAVGKLQPPNALQLIPQICAALQFAHEEGIVHRDIKPENILVDKKGRVKIADFGIAKILGQSGNATLTGAKDVVGTPHYMAPEQVEKPQTVDHRADIYSLGVVFYEMLTGELPLGRFQSPSRKVRVDIRFDEIVLHALEKEPERRYQHASEVKTDVEAIASGATPPPPVPADSQAPAPSKLKLKRGQRLMLWYGVAMCAIGLPASLVLRMPWITFMAIIGLVIGGYKLGWFGMIAPPGGSNPTTGVAGAPNPDSSLSWVLTAALSCVVFCWLAVFGVLASSLFHLDQTASVVAFILLITLLPLIVLGSSRVVRRWSAMHSGENGPSGAPYFKIAAWTGLGISVLYAGFAVFFFAALLGERGGWNPAPSEAIIVPLCWIGALMLPLSVWHLFRAGSASAASRSGFPYRNP
ncbi:MAG TPA: protein kinase, partial [Clostridia bacterium]|nr:protein kinase [Clostridia bacterium]